MLEIRRCGVVIAASLTFVGCGGGSGSSAMPEQAAIGSARAVEMTDLEIAQLLYADNHRTPAGFHLEATPAVSGYLATAHLKNTDLPGDASATQYELCTDDWTDALAWSDQVAAASSALSDTRTTTSYYEFGRVRSGTPPGYLRARVYRCSYLNRSTVDLRRLEVRDTGTGSILGAGQFNQRPLTAAELQMLVEYLWQFTVYNNYGSAVLKSSGATSGAGLQHALIIATFVATGGGCDHVTVFDWKHTADLQTGALQLEIQTLWDFGARRVAGTVELCNPFD